MSELEFYRIFAWAWIGTAGITFVSLFFVTAPYGRFARAGWGPRMSNRLGWILQEAPASLLMLGLWWFGQHRLETVPLVLLGCWQIHYVHRAFVFPFRLRGERRQTTLLTVCLAIAFNTANAYLNGRWIFHLGPAVGPEWLLDPRFVAGAILFWIGFAVNKHADHVLIHLRQPGETGYKIPRGGLYRLLSAPNYFGEILQWGGFALMAWNLGSLSFFVWTTANLAPRAFAIHRWYRQQFADYPPERKALIPFIA
jgi:hypothetical protein